MNAHKKHGKEIERSSQYLKTRTCLCKHMESLQKLPSTRHDVQAPCPGARTLWKQKNFSQKVEFHGEVYRTHRDSTFAPSTQEAIVSQDAHLGRLETATATPAPNVVWLPAFLVGQGSVRSCGVLCDSHCLGTWHFVCIVVLHMPSSYKRVAVTGQTKESFRSSPPGPQATIQIHQARPDELTLARRYVHTASMWRIKLFGAVEYLDSR